MAAEFDQAEIGFSGIDQREQITRGPLVAEPGERCERCEGDLSVGDRTYLIGRNVGGCHQCCEHCAVAGGAHDELVSETPTTTAF